MWGQIVQTWWPLILTIAGGIIWAIRQEGRINQITDTINKFYATKDEVARLEGAINAVSVQLPDMKGALTRIESKLDTFVITEARKHS